MNFANVYDIDLEVTPSIWFVFDDLVFSGGTHGETLLNALIDEHCLKALKKGKQANLQRKKSFISLRERNRQRGFLFWTLTVLVNSISEQVGRRNSDGCERL